MKRFSNIKLKKILSKMGINQVSLSEKLDVAPSTVSAWLLGKALPEKQNIKKVADLLSVAEDDLLIKIPEDLEALGLNSAGVYVCNCENINISNDRQIDILFPINTEGKPDCVTVGIQLSMVALSKIILKASEAHKEPGQYISELIEGSVSEEGKS
jgi:transcriptional regulator with XRE-family HTH domain